MRFNIMVASYSALHN